MSSYLLPDHRLRLRTGVLLTALSVLASFVLPVSAQADEPTVELLDVSGNIFEKEMTWMVQEGISHGCNPPEGSRFCPDDPVTRGQMAAFLYRALRLEPGDVSFTDTVGHLFETEVSSLASAGITRGCNPPDNDRYCPDDPITRGQMAAFLYRALQLEPGDVSFTDTVGHLFEAEISSLASAGITRGCNPPVNDRFCPDRTITRGEMAAFLYRALTNQPEPEPEPEPLAITTSALPDGQVGVTYTATLTATGGTPPYSWSATGLPDGLDIDPTSGQVTGTPQAGTHGDHTIDITVVDDQGTTESTQLTLTIEPSPLEIEATSLPNGREGVPYSATLAAAGGVPPYEWEVSGLPAGLEIDPATGEITGSPLEATAGEHILGVTLTDDQSTQATAQLSLTVDPPAFASISGGRHHTCGISTLGDAYCWGSGSFGQLGNGSVGEYSTPQEVEGLHTFTVITTGDDHSCGITDTGDAYCWGDGDYGQLGNGAASDHDTPQLVHGGLQFIDIDAGDYHTCGITTDGLAYCWGYGNYGQLGNGEKSDRNSPTLVDEELRFGAITAGSLFTCGLTPQGEAYCWGYGGDGELGNNGISDHATPQAVAGQHTFLTIDSGEFHTCGITDTGTGYCWGSGFDGKLGTGNTNDALIPMQVAGGHVFTDIAAGRQHSCGITDSGAAYCWGDRERGQLGDGGFDERSLTPTPVEGGLTFDLISTGSWHTCGVTTDGRAHCWGFGTRGQLGNDDSQDYATPQEVVTPW